MKLKGIDENTAVHCPTEELSEKVLKIAKEAGCSPFLVNSMYCNYEKDTCYNLMNGTFSDIRYYKNIKDYTILPAEEFIKLNTMKQLPEKWAIKTDDPEFYEWVNANKSSTDVVCLDFDCYIHFPSPFKETHDKTWIACDYIEEGYEEITIDQWREAVKQDDQVEILKSVLTNTPKEEMDKIFNDVKSSLKPEETGELIGYEAPEDLYKGNYIEVKKGTLFTKKDGGYTDKKELTFFPPEWVERDWKPVYKAKEKKRVPKSFVDVYENGRLWGAFPDKKEAVQRVKEKGKVGCKYTYQEVDYITEE